MPQFQMDTSGKVEQPDSNPAMRTYVGRYRSDDKFGPLSWCDLDTFTQAYIEAMFFTESGDGRHLTDKGFSDLSPEALTSIIADCQAFQCTPAYTSVRNAEDNEELGDLFESCGGVSTQAGHDFWMTRQGHGCGFCDGDWPEPYASALDAAAKVAGECEPYLGDDGLIYL